MNPLTLYALRSILDHLSEENYGPSSVYGFCYEGRAAARVIIKRTIRQEEGLVDLLWNAEKDKD